MNKEELASYVNVYINTLKYRPDEDVRDVLLDFLFDLEEFLMQGENENVPNIIPKENEKEKTAHKPIRIDGVTEECPKCGEKVMYAVGTGIMFHGASESYEDWRVIKHDYCPKCGIKIER